MTGLEAEKSKIEVPANLVSNEDLLFIMGYLFAVSSYCNGPRDL